MNAYKVQPSVYVDSVGRFLNDLSVQPDQMIPGQLCRGESSGLAGGEAHTDM